MPRLIGAEDLGQAATPRPQAQTVGYRAGIAQTAGAQAAEDIAATGQYNLRREISAVGEQRDAANRQQVAAAQSAFAKAQIDTETGFQGDQDYATYKPRYDEAMKKSLGDISASIEDPRLRQTFVDGAGVDIAHGQARLGAKAYGMQTDAQRGHLQTLMDQNLETALKAPDQATADKVFQATNDAIAAARDGGWISPVDYANQTRTFATNYATALYAKMPASERLAALVPGGHGPSSTSGHGPAIAVEPLPPSDVTKAIDRNAKTPEDADLLKRFAAIESKGNPDAVNPQSGATGAFQFMPQTGTAYGLDEKTAKDPEKSAAAATALLADNRTALQGALGRAPTAAEQYLAWQQGATGAAALLANPDASAIGVLTAVYGNAGKAAAAIQQNGGHPDMTAGQFATLWTERFDGRQGNSGPVTLADSLTVPPGGYDFSKKTGTPADLIPIDTRVKMIEQAQSDVKEAANKARIQLQAGVEVGFEDAKQNAFNNGTVDPGYPAQVMAAYPDERGAAKLRELDRQAELGQVNKVVKVNSEADDQTLLAGFADQAAQPGPGSAAAAQRLSDAQTLIKAKQDALKKDPGLWSQQNSPVVADALQAWSSATDPKEQAIAFNVYAASTTAEQQRQGVADPKILPEDVATKLGEQLNPKPGQSSRDAVATIRQMEQQFGGYVPQVFGQISSKMGDAALTVAVMAPSQDLAAARLIEANQNKDAIEKSTTGTVGTDIKNEVAGAFASFMGTFSHDPAALGEGLKYQNQAELLARSYVATGMTPAAAAQRARKEIIDPIYDTSTGVRVPVKWDPDSVQAGAEQVVQNIGTVGLDPVLDDTGAGAEAQQQYLRSVQANHTWVNSSDGQGLVMIDQLNRPVLKDGKPFQVNFDQLQQIGQTVPVTAASGLPQQAALGGSYSVDPLGGMQPKGGKALSDRLLVPQSAGPEAPIAQTPQPQATSDLLLKLQSAGPQPAEPAPSDAMLKLQSAGPGAPDALRPDEQAAEPKPRDQSAAQPSDFLQRIVRRATDSELATLISEGKGDVLTAARAEKKRRT